MVSKKADQIKKLHRDGCFHVQLGRGLTQRGILQAEKRALPPYMSDGCWRTGLQTHHSYSNLWTSVKIPHLMIRFWASSRLIVGMMSVCKRWPALLKCCFPQVTVSWCTSPIRNPCSSWVDLQNLLLCISILLVFERTRDMSDILNIHPLLRRQSFRCVITGGGIFH